MQSMYYMSGRSVSMAHNITIVVYSEQPDVKPVTIEIDMFYDHYTNIALNYGYSYTDIALNDAVPVIYVNRNNAEELSHLYYLCGEGKNGKIRELIDQYFGPLP